MIPQIHALTGNLLWEQTLTFPKWATGRTQRATSAAFQVGGKGINVAKMLARLSAPGTALCFPGRATGAECEAWVRAQGIACRTFPVARSTRLGLVVRSPDQPETTFLGPDAPIEESAAQACADYLDQCTAGDVLAVCGSVPGWGTDACAPLRVAIGRWIARGPVVADTYGPPLQWLIEQPVAWVKVNRNEFDALFNEAERSGPVVNRLRLAAERWLPRAWIVTDGPEPVWFIEQGGSPSSLTPPPVTEVSSTGSGDVLHACLLHAVFHHRRTLADALQQALPYAAANAAHAGVADFPLENLPPIGPVAQPEQDSADA
jgi:fructose-1-phosphate kinase PfkB-like protein